jgi:hypothetical protein
MILGKGGGVFHAENAAIPFDRFLRILAAQGGVMDTGELWSRH